uniref:NADH dehydrogenase subunit 6 n=1 Tax=Yuukianura szeptyckii TaxID=1453868 RepID=A0A7T0M4H1_9HEXA|nr:NADH dehydrogenase subunit 6 [Yuukianura szeptyckii]QPL15830.1 NADH dehydrogenase subunit 6 [Yuukianura szeptyckii]
MSFFQLMLMLLNSFFLVMNTTPLMILIVTISQTLMICVFMKMYLFSAWFSFLLFLIFVGGLMILFSYVTSLSPNNPSYIDMNMYIYMFLSMSLILSLFFIFYFQETKFMHLSSNIFVKIYKIYSPSTSTIITSLFLFLLLALLIAVYLILKNSGPLRSVLKSL